MQRKTINEVYSTNLPADIQLPEGYQEWRFNIIVPHKLRDDILIELFANGLFASCHYRSANRLFDNEVFTRSDHFQRKVINLFNDQYYSLEKAYLTCRIINKVMNTLPPPC